MNNVIMPIPERRRVIFLDIDGVLMNERAYSWVEGSRRLRHVADTACVEALNAIIRATGADIVVSSVWRHRGRAEVANYLQEWGVVGNVIDRTPSIPDAPRGHEIAAWLRDNSAYSLAIMYLTTPYVSTKLPPCQETMPTGTSVALKLRRPQNLRS